MRCAVSRFTEGGVRALPFLVSSGAFGLGGGRILTCVDTGGPSPSNVKLSLTNVVVVTDAFHRESGSGIDVNPGPIEIGEFGC